MNETDLEETHSEDMYNIYLTQHEIQGHIKRINQEIAFSNIICAFRDRNQSLLKSAVEEIQIKDFEPVSFSNYSMAATSGTLL